MGSKLLAEWKVSHHNGYDDDRLGDRSIFRPRTATYSASKHGFYRAHDKAMEVFRDSQSTYWKSEMCYGDEGKQGQQGSQPFEPLP